MKFKIIILLFIIASSVQSLELEKVVTFGRDWRFEIGDEKHFADPDFNDNNWERIRVPGAWENNGFPGYDGFAWYRISFKIDADLKNDVLYIRLGRIDDVDQVFLNGRLLEGTGSMPPDFSTAYNVERRYYIPNNFLKFGQTNYLAIRIYDSELKGGIIEGPVGIYQRTDLLDLDINLAGQWKFTQGDNLMWSDPNYDDSNWDSIEVPAKWESQGYPGYDGYGWYRTRFELPKQLAGKKLVLALGMIDDIDQVYFNGELIGSTGRFPGEKYAKYYNDYWNSERYYRIPDYILNQNGENTIAVRVYDVWLDGGIYERPIGITQLQKYDRFRDERPAIDKFWDWLLGK